MPRGAGDDGIESNASVGDDGMFWMAWDDFRKHFVNVDVCAPFLFQPGSTLRSANTLRSRPPRDGLPASAGHDPARYVPPRLVGAAAHENAPWREQRIKSRFTSGPPKAGGAPSQLFASDAFVFEVPPLAQRFTPAQLAAMGPTERAQAGREHVSCLFTLSQLDTRRAAMAHGYVDAGLCLLYTSPSPRDS